MYISYPFLSARWLFLPVTASLISLGKHLRHFLVYLCRVTLQYLVRLSCSLLFSSSFYSYTIFLFPPTLFSLVALPACQAISLLFFGADHLYCDQLSPAILSLRDRNLLEKHWRTHV
jgi:hypothetical protein